MVARDLPTRSATRSWVSPNSSISWRYASGLVDRVEVGALDVLDERDLELVAVRELADERRDALEARQRAARTRRSPATSW